MRKGSIFIQEVDPVLEILKKKKAFLQAAIYAKTPSRHKKKKVYTIACSQLGIFVMSNSSITKGMEVRFFIPIESITSITKINDIRITIESKGDPTPRELESKNIDVLIKSICESFGRLQYNKTKPLKIKFSQFPMPGPQVEIPKSLPAHLVMTRYLAECAKYDATVNENMLREFERFQDTPKTVIYFTEKCGAPPHANCVAIPLLYEPDLTSVIFEGFAPRMVCRIAHKLIKNHKKIRHITFKGYKVFIPELLNLEKIDNPSVVSLALENIEIDEDKQIDLIREISKYKGDFQQIRFSGMSIKQKFGEKLGTSIAAEHCFRTLEILTVNNINCEGADPYQIMNSLMYSIKRLAVLQRFEATGWEPKISFHPQSGNNVTIAESDSLSVLALSNYDFRLVGKPIQFPATLHHLEINNCIFTGKSLTFFITSIAKIQAPFSLFLNNMRITQIELQQFLTSMKDHPPLKNLCELDWSNNKLPSNLIKPFADLFITENLKIINLSGCFKVTELKSLDEILLILSKIKLWGLELEGVEPECVFKDDINKIFASLVKIKTLEHLNISNHGFKSVAAHELLNHLNEIKGLQEISVDGTGLEGRTPIYGFYILLYEIQQIKSIARPLKDLKRIMDESVNNFNFNQEKLGPKWCQYKSKMASTAIPQDRFARTAFFIRKKELSQYLDFMSHYPISLQANDPPDRWGINAPEQKMIPLRSLVDEKMEIIPGSLGDYQNSLFNSPYTKTPEDLTLKFGIPDIIASRKNVKIVISRDFVPPVIRKEINIEKVLTKFHTFIKKENKQIIRYLDLIDQFFFNQTYGNIQNPYLTDEAIIQPKIYIEDEEYDVVHQKIDEFHEDDEVSESSFTLSSNPLNNYYPTTHRNSLYGSKQLSNFFEPTDSLLSFSSGNLSVIETLDSNGDFSDEELKVDTVSPSILKKIPSPIKVFSRPILKKKQVKPRKDIFIPFTPQEDIIHSIMSQKAVFDKTLEEIESENENSKQKEVLIRLRNSFNVISEEYSFRKLKVDIPVIDNSSASRSTISSFLSPMLSKYCTTVTTQPKEDPNAKPGISLPTFVSSDEEQAVENDIPTIQIHSRERSGSINKLPNKVRGNEGTLLYIPAARSGEGTTSLSSSREFTGASDDASRRSGTDQSITSSEDDHNHDSLLSNEQDKIHFSNNSTGKPTIEIPALMQPSIPPPLMPIQSTGMIGIPPPLFSSGGAPMQSSGSQGAIPPPMGLNMPKLVPPSSIISPLGVVPPPTIPPPIGGAMPLNGIPPPLAPLSGGIPQLNRSNTIPGISPLPNLPK